MKKLHILFAALCLVLAGACSSDDILEQTPETPETPDTPQAKGQRITIRASVDDAMGTKAGVYEGNLDYDAGERFYWNDNDQIKLFFVKLGEDEKEIPEVADNLPTSYFTATNASGNTADFTGNIPAGLDGTYNIYACSHKVEQINMIGFLGSSLQQDQKQMGKSSKQLYADGNMELWGRAVKGVEIKDGKLVGKTPELSYEMVQLNAMLRFTISNTMDQAMTVKSVSITTKDAGGGNCFDFLNYYAYLSYSPNNEAWSSFYTNTWSTMSLTIDQNEGEAMIGEGIAFDAYMCVLPSNGVLAADASFVVDVLLEDADGTLYLRQGTITEGIDGFDFLYNGGLQGGMRYYFQIALTKDNTKEVVYKVGDLYPSADAPEGIVCSVNAAGTVGKILSLNETTKAWGKDGQTLGSMNPNDGESNTKYMDDFFSIAEYPAFAWCVGKGDGWYLPAQYEMQGVATVKETLNNVLNVTTGADVLSGGYYYWTSTVPFFDTENNSAIVSDPNNTMGSDTDSRSASHFVRAMKKFDITK